MALIINILSTSRFWLCDLARELDAQGFKVRFYSFVPTHRTRKYGLRDECNFSLLFFVSPFLFLDLSLKKIGVKRLGGKIILVLVDIIASKIMKRCDLFIGMSGIAVRSAKKMKKKYNAKIFIERGSRHILSQKEILDKLKNLNSEADTVSEFDVSRELKSYGLADIIVIPSRHVENSFLEYGFAKEKLFRNPYGVSFEMFPPKKFQDHILPTIMVVGIWSLRKGCDLLVEAWKKLDNVKLIHVGNIGDLDLPLDKNFEHYEAVDQERLSYYYSLAHVLVLPSREDGLALVQAQALSSGLYLVCSDKTGGEDLLDYIDNKELITVVPSEDTEKLSQAIKTVLAQALKKNDKNFISNSRKTISWNAYGERYAEFLRSYLIQK